MAEKRKFETVICVKNGAKTLFKLELFPAEQWEKSAQGRYRCRINRRWHDLVEGGAAYLDMQQVGGLVATLAGSGAMPLPAPAPDLPRSSRVSVPNGNVIGGQIMYDRAQTVSDPILGYDGRWFVQVYTWDQGHMFVPVNDLTINSRWDGQRHVPVK